MRRGNEKRTYVDVFDDEPFADIKIDHKLTKPALDSKACYRPSSVAQAQLAKRRRQTVSAASLIPESKVSINKARRLTVVGSNFPALAATESNVHRRHKSIYVETAQTSR